MDHMQRWLKFCFILIITFAVLITGVFIKREALMLHFSKNYLAEYEISLTCSDVKLDSSLNLVIDKLCIKHALFDVQITKAHVQWFYESGFGLSKIDVSLASIQGIKPLLIESSNTSLQPLKKMHSILEQISQFNLAVPISINKLTYKSFNSNKDYQGHLSALNNDYKLQLNTASQVNVLTTVLNIKNNEINAKVTVNAHETLDFLAQHNIALPVEIKSDLTVKGSINSEFQWKDNLLHIKQHTEKLRLKSQKGIFGSGAFELDHDVTWHAKIDGNVIDLEFEPQSKVALDYKQKPFLELLDKKRVPHYVLNLLKDNKKEHLVFEPKGQFKVNFEQQSIKLDAFTILAPQLEKVSYLRLNDLYSTFTASDVKTDFILNSELDILKHMTQEATLVNLSGQINKKLTELEISFKPDSNIILKNVKTDALIIPDLKFQLMGEVNLFTQSDTHFDLNLLSQANKSQLNNIIKTKEILIDTKITGSLRDINISGSTVLDNIKMAEYFVSGEISKPFIDIYMQQISLNSVLALNIANKPDIALIDGALSYQLKGQLTDINNVRDNDFVLSVNVSNVIGEINDTWFEELNWQQDFILQKGEVKTKALENNLSIKNIDVGTPITDLSVSSAINFINDNLKVDLTDFNANAFGGSFNIPVINWPIDSEKTVEINLEQIDLSKIIELEKQQGIQVTGKVSGKIPVFIGDNITIENGKLYNIGEGIIRIKDNPGVESLKQSSTELALAFEALDNLHYHQLNADVSMYDNGRMLLDTVIKGRNPDLDNEVNLNLNINYDLIGLIKSLRIADDVQSEINQKLQQH